MIKASARTFARGYKKRTQLGKKHIQCRFPDFINRKYFTLILKTMILTALINSVTSTEIFKIQKQSKISQENICVGVFLNEVNTFRL